MWIGMPRGEIIMKMKGKVIVLVLWIVLSFAAAITATFAWVSMNTENKGDNMKFNVDYDQFFVDYAYYKYKYVSLHCK